MRDFVLEKTSHHLEWEILVKDFDEDAVQNFKLEVDYFFKQDPNRPILITISSNGGVIDELFAMLDIMDAYRSKGGEGFGFITQAIGKAFSAGAILLAYGDYRLASKNTRIMLHQAIGGAGGPYGSPFIEVRNDFEEFARINQRLLQILLDSAHFRDIEHVKEYLDRDRFLTPIDALNLGIIDAVGTASIEEVRAFQINVVDAYRPEESKEGESDDVRNRKANSEVASNKSEDSSLSRTPRKRKRKSVVD